MSSTRVVFFIRFFKIVVSNINNGKSKKKTIVCYERPVTQKSKFSVTSKYTLFQLQLAENMHPN